MFYEEEQISMFAPDIWSGKMSPEPSAPTEAMTSQRSSKKPSGSQSRKPPIFQCLKKDGLRADASGMSWVSGALPGEFSMHSFGEHPISLYHNGVGESHLSQILEDSPHQKYSLSAKACRGILNRANRSGKKLPEILELVLERQCASSTHKPFSEDTTTARMRNGVDPGNAALDTIGNNGDIAGTLDSSYYKGPGMRSGVERTFVTQLQKDVWSIGGGMPNNTGLFDKAATLNCLDQQQMVMVPVGEVECRNTMELPMQTGTPQSDAAININGNSALRANYIARRLTPLECERLQGFPDGWTDIGEWVDSKGKKHKEADSPRYKALGNSIAIPPWKWVLKRLCACYERDATMASLFDGIGGFPYIWEQLNGKGSCLWASEVEEFPVAVTKLRFGE